MKPRVCHIDIDFLRFARKEVESVRLLRKLARHKLAVAVLRELAAELFCEPVRLLVDGKKRYSLNIHQTRRHFKEFARDLEIFFFKFFHIIKILIDEIHYRHIFDPDLMLADEVQKEIHRALKRFNFIRKSLHKNLTLRMKLSA